MHFFLPTIFNIISLIWRRVALQVLPRGLRGKESACQCKRCKFSPRVGKIPWRRKGQPTAVFLPGESHGHRSDCSSWYCIKHPEIAKRVPLKCFYHKKEMLIVGRGWGCWLRLRWSSFCNREVYQNNTWYNTLFNVNYTSLKLEKYIHKNRWNTSLEIFYIQ